MGAGQGHGWWECVLGILPITWWHAKHTGGGNRAVTQRKVVCACCACRSTVTG